MINKTSCITTVTYSNIEIIYTELTRRTYRERETKYWATKMHGTSCTALNYETLLKHAQVL